MLGWLHDARMLTSFRTSSSASSSSTEITLIAMIDAPSPVSPSRRHCALYTDPYDPFPSLLCSSNSLFGSSVLTLIHSRRPSRDFLAGEAKFVNSRVELVIRGG